MQESLENKNFTHFKIHTQYSICEGAIRIDDLKEFCKKNKIKSLGISDSSNLSGALEFSENISKQGTQPIIGTQIIFEFDGFKGFLTLIAKNLKGYKRIIEISSKSYLENKDINDPYCKFEELSKNCDGIIVMSGSINGLIGKLFNLGKTDKIEKIYKKLILNFNQNFYIEIQRHGDKNEKLFEKFNLNQSYKFNIPIIASHEAFYIDKSMHDAHEALICIGNKSYLNDKDRISYSNNHYLKSDNEMFEKFKDLPEALENNYNLPLRCTFRPLPSKPILPNLSSKDDKNADKKLTDDSFNGLKNKFVNYFCKENENPEEVQIYEHYKKRLDHEIKIITEMNFSSYFLIVSDYIKWAKKNDIPVGPGRGSGAGSLVAWCLSITNVDPIKFNLIFERFLNPDRVSMPF